MKKFEKNELTREMVEKAMACETADELLALAKAEGYEMTKDEAEAYLAELSDLELDSEQLKSAAGGYCNDCATVCTEVCHFDCHWDGKH